MKSIGKVLLVVVAILTFASATPAEARGFWPFFFPPRVVVAAPVAYPYAYPYAPYYGGYYYGPGYGYYSHGYYGHRYHRFGWHHH